MTVQGLIEAVDDAVPLVTLTTAGYAGWIESQPARVATWLRRTGFEADAGRWQVVPEVDGDIAMVVAGLGDAPDLWSAASLPSELPDDLCLKLDPDGDGAADAVAEGWTAGCYRFTRYRKAKRGHASLVWPEPCDRAGITARAEAVCLGRDLVNTPAEDMGPADLEDVAEAIANRAGATLAVIQGEKLLSEGYPAVHAVGRASARPPRLLDFHWGRDDAPKVTLVGKGVCFDSGGHDLKNAAGMEKMKKDMGGAACALAVARMVMDMELPVRLRVLIPAVENALDGNAIKPADIITTRKGIKIEIGDTDAEGRVILADALAAACEEEPELLIDFATLTGAARVALGQDLAACFAKKTEDARALCEAGMAVSDPLWPMPLVKAYLPRMASDLAEINTIADWAFADHIQAALFLEKFVGVDTSWIHIDTVCWNEADRAGRPKGGEVQSARAVFELLCRRYGAGA